jgi:hypothetical protein
MYPLDVLSEEDAGKLVERAIRSDCEIADWRDRLIGKPFEPDRFVQILESYL